MSNTRNSTTMPSVIQSCCPVKKYETDGSASCRSHSEKTHGRKQNGMAMISSSTTEGGSVSPKIFSASLQSQMEKAMPSMAPARYAQKLPVAIKTANHTSPRKEPKVPGAKGI